MKRWRRCSRRGRNGRHRRPPARPPRGDASDVVRSTHLGHGCGRSTSRTSMRRPSSWTTRGTPSARSDCLVNNAAIGKRKLVTDHSADDVDMVMRTNFLSPIRMNLAVLPKMLERGRGTIVNVASGGGRFGIAHESAYCASKFAMSGWTEVAAMDLADTPIEVKLVQPGAIDTEIWIQQPGELAGLPGAQFVIGGGLRRGNRRRARVRRVRVLRARRLEGARRLEEQRRSGMDRPHGGLGARDSRLTRERFTDASSGRRPRLRQ